MPDHSPTPTSPRRIRFGLRSLFVLVAVAAVVRVGEVLAELDSAVAGDAE